MYNQQYFNPYFNPMDQSRQQPSPQIIQNFSKQVPPQSYCYFVKSANDLAGVNIMPNTLYLGINQDNKEVYVKKMNNDGNIELETYSLLSEKKEKTDLQSIAERLENIEKKLSELPKQRPILTVENRDERVTRTINK